MLLQKISCLSDTRIIKTSHLDSFEVTLDIFGWKIDNESFDSFSEVAIANRFSFSVVPHSLHCVRNRLRSDAREVDATPQRTRFTSFNFICWSSRPLQSFDFVLSFDFSLVQRCVNVYFFRTVNAIVADGIQVWFLRPSPRWFDHI